MKVDFHNYTLNLSHVELEIKEVKNLQQKCQWPICCFVIVSLKHFVEEQSSPEISGMSFLKSIEVCNLFT